MKVPRPPPPPHSFSCAEFCWRANKAERCWRSANFHFAGLPSLVRSMPCRRESRPEGLGKSVVGDGTAAAHGDFVPHRARRQRLSLHVPRFHQADNQAVIEQWRTEPRLNRKSQQKLVL